MEFSKLSLEETLNPGGSERPNQSRNETPPRRIIACIEEPLDTYLRLNPNLDWQVNRNYGRNKKCDGSMESITGSNLSVASGIVVTSYDTEDLTNFVVQTNPKKYIEADHKHHTKEKYTDHRWTDLKDHFDTSLAETREQSRREFEKLLIILLQESAKRAAAEERLHTQLQLQSETMVAMELKLLKLEAKIDRRESAYRSRRPPIIEKISRQRPPSILSSTASLASAVTPASLLRDGDDDFEQNVDEKATSNAEFDPLPSECKLKSNSCGYDIFMQFKVLTPSQFKSSHTKFTTHYNWNFP